MSTTKTVNKKARVNQVYRKYLDTLFYHDYYIEMRERTLKYSSNFDFVIGLGTVLTGGSGIGILASASFAWLCGLFTAGSAVLAVAKTSYQWPDRLRKSTELITFYEKIASRYAELVEDVQAIEDWNDHCENQLLSIRKRAQTKPTDYPYARLSEDKMREIQNRIKARLNYHDWWNNEFARAP